MEENTERNYKQTEEDNRLLILILVASFIIISMIIIIGSTACILLCFEGSIEEKEEEIQEALSKLTEKKRKNKRLGKQNDQKAVVTSKGSERTSGPEHKEGNFSDDTRVTTSFTGVNTSQQDSSKDTTTTSDSCLLEQLRVSDNWRHLVNVEQACQYILPRKMRGGGKYFY